METVQELFCNSNQERLPHYFCKSLVSHLGTTVFRYLPIIANGHCSRSIPILQINDHHSIFISLIICLYAIDPTTSGFLDLVVLPKTKLGIPLHSVIQTLQTFVQKHSGVSGK